MLSSDESEFFWRNGYCQVGRVLSRGEALVTRRRVEQFEVAHPEAIGKLDLKVNLLFTWLDSLSAHPKMLAKLESLLGPNILCHSGAFRNKAPDRRTFVGWHQDTTYERVDPFKVIGWYAISDATKSNGCLRVIPGSHQWGQLEHLEARDADSMLSHGHHVSESLDESSAVEIELEAGEAVLFHYGVVHGSAPNCSSDRRMGLFFDYVATDSVHAGNRESARLVQGVDVFGNYDHEPAPVEDFGTAEVAAHRSAVEKLSANFYSAWSGDIEALSGRARNRI